MEEIKNGKNRIIGLGAALMDILVHESDAFIDKIGFPKGGMTLVDLPVLEDVLSRTTNPTTVVPGGSACNTAVGVGRLGGKSRFVGKRGDDDLGRFFEKALVERGVQPNLMVSSTPTGRVLSIITPDAQRTMLTYLGASAETLPEELVPDHFTGGAVVHIEGYWLFNPDLMLASLKAAKSAGCLVSLDLSSFTVVEQSKDMLEEIIPRYVDILIANEDEAKAYTGLDVEEEAIEHLFRNVDVAVLKVGAKGSYIRSQSGVCRVAPQGSGSAVDTTGAGDLWASGFLYGMVRGFPHGKCGALASACGYEVCQVIGADIPDDGWMRIKKNMEA